MILCEVQLCFSGLCYSPSKWGSLGTPVFAVPVVVFCNLASGAGKLIFIFPYLYMFRSMWTKSSAQGSMQNLHDITKNGSYHILLLGRALVRYPGIIMVSKFLCKETTCFQFKNLWSSSYHLRLTESLQSTEGIKAHSIHVQKR